MNNKEILLVVDAVSNEKNIDRQIIFEAIESALAAASKKLSDAEIDARVAIDNETGDYETFRRWIVIDDNEEIDYPDRQIYVTDAQEKDEKWDVGDYIEEPMENVKFGRIAAQTAKQVIAGGSNRPVARVHSNRFPRSYLGYSGRFDSTFRPRR